MLRACFRTTDIVTRYGGEEFVAMIRVNQMEEAEKLAWRILANMQESSFIKSNPNYKITLSVGIAFVNEEDTIESLLEKADFAMYKAKEGGRNQVSRFQK
jgi:diguanylate cyclase